MAPSEVFLIHIKQFINKTWIAKVLIEIVMIALAILLATVAKDFIQKIADYLLDKERIEGDRFRDLLERYLQYSEIDVSDLQTGSAGLQAAVS